MEPRLYYLNSGTRRYGEQAVRAYGRPYWEFQAVLRGRIAVLRPEGPGSPVGPALWVFEQGNVHGWTAPAGEEAEIIVFHLSPPDRLLQREVRRRGGELMIPLEAADITWLEGQGERLTADWIKPTESSFLKVSHLLSGLSLMILGRSGYSPEPPGPGIDRERVEKALYWYGQNLDHQPGVEAVARAVGISAVHLRRLFARELGRPPKRAFQAIRMEAGRALLEDPRLTVEAVAVRLNFADASSFTRAYRREFGQPPRRGA